MHDPGQTVRKWKLAEKIYFGSETPPDLRLLLIIFLSKISDAFITTAPEIDHNLLNGIVLVVARPGQFTDILLDL